MLTPSDDGADVFAAVPIGAMGYLVKGVAADHVVSAIAAIAAGLGAPRAGCSTFARSAGHRSSPISRTAAARAMTSGRARTTSYNKRTAVAFAVLEDVVAIIEIFHRGRDYEAIPRTTET